MKNKVVLVTGSSRGIGREIALGLAEKGSCVAVHCLRNIKEAELTAEAVRESGAQTAVFRADLKDETEAFRLITEVEGRFGHIDILVNNVGPILAKRWDSLCGGDWDEVIRGNLHSAFFCLKFVLPGMKECGWGRIINIGAVDRLFRDHPLRHRQDGTPDPDQDGGRRCRQIRDHRQHGLSRPDGGGGASR